MSSTEGQKSAEAQAAYFNEYDQELLEKGVPPDSRISVSENVHFKREGHSLWEDAVPHPAADAAQYAGQYYMENSALCFVDRNGAAWVTGDSPNHRKALEEAGYSQNPDIVVPFAQGELLSEHEKNPSSGSMESQQDKWKRIKESAQNDWEAQRARDNV